MPVLEKALGSCFCLSLGLKPRRATTADLLRQATPGCSVRYACPNFGYQRTPFSVGSARYDLATGRLCYAVTAANPCTGCTTRACRSTTGGVSSSTLNSQPDSSPQQWEARCTVVLC
jgi:hypothetical protein